nr:hypothetical protein [uncultured Desulfobacter sp.]
MVSPQANDFFIFAEYLIAMAEYPDEYIQVKIRDKEIENDTHDYQGEIWGKMTISDLIKPEDSEMYASILLCFGPAGKAMRFDDSERKFKDVVEEHRYTFPFDEFEGFLIAVEAMAVQEKDFKALKRGSSILTKRKIKARNLRQQFRDKLF